MCFDSKENTGMGDTMGKVQKPYEYQFSHVWCHCVCITFEQSMQNGCMLQECLCDTFIAAKYNGPSHCMLLWVST